MVMHFLYMNPQCATWVPTSSCQRFSGAARLSVRLRAIASNSIISIHIKPAEGTCFSGDEARIDIDQNYFVKMANQSGLRLKEVPGCVYGQPVLVFEKI